jgi:hypothetical protein
MKLYLYPSLLPHQQTFCEPSRDESISDLPQCVQSTYKSLSAYQSLLNYIGPQSIPPIDSPIRSTPVQQKNAILGFVYSARRGS